jgi:hypothetical protein
VLEVVAMVCIAWYCVNMANASKRGLTSENRARMFFPEHPVTPQWLAKHLNEFQSDPRGERSRIVQLIRDLNELDMIASVKGYPDGEDLFRYSNGKKAKIILERIDVLLRPVWFSPRLVFPAGHGWKPSWHVRSTITGKRDNFSIAAAWVYDLAVSGQLSLLRLCDHCEKWFAAPKNLMSHRFCSTACRTSSHRKTPEGRQSRRAYMREYMREYRTQPDDD